MNLVDLHSHTNCSDGFLSPAELLVYAAERDIQLLAITDHDNVDAYKQLCGSYDLLHNKAFINIQLETNKSLYVLAGVEISCSWTKHNIHVVGLGMDITNSAFSDFIIKQKQIRYDRVSIIAEQLKTMGITGTDALIAELDDKTIESFGRKHFADFLVATKQAKDMKQAFANFLSDKLLTQIQSLWPSIDSAVKIITDAGGIAVLAHPAKYKLSRYKIGLLIDDFVDAGGESIELVSAMQNQSITDFLMEKCQTEDLLISAGSDFHQPNLGWSDVGKFTYLPTQGTKIWTRWPELAEIPSH